MYNMMSTRSTYEMKEVHKFCIVRMVPELCIEQDING